MNMKELKRVILLLESSRNFGRELLYGIARYSRLHTAWSFYREPCGLKTSVPRLTNWNASGIIMRDSLITKELLNLELPTILVLHDAERPKYLPIVITDAKTIVKLAADHLLDRGLKHFAFCGYKSIFWSNNRESNFQKYIEDAGFEVHIYEPPVQHKFKSWYHEQSFMKDWLKKLPKPIGIMACNDDRGQHILEVCKSLRINVPEEVAVIGVDNDQLICELGDPPLTSVALNTESAGYAAAELLDRLMNGEKMKGQEILVSATHVVKRQSTDLLAIEDKNVANAIKFIRQNAKNKLRVDDVVAETCLGRRSLESGFRKILQRSIQEEIRRVRVELISQMLIETDMSVAQITSLFNFADYDHISRYFKKEKGLGLREFRKLYRKC
jgi:LacI family transcriptional regulator